MKNILAQFPDLKGHTFEQDVLFLLQAARTEIPEDYALFLKRVAPKLDQIQFVCQNETFRFLNVTEMVEEISQHSCQTEEIDLAYLEFGALNTLQKIPIAVSENYDIIHLNLSTGSVIFDEKRWKNFNEFLTQIKWLARK